jgi:hypothetical protein
MEVTIMRFVLVAALGLTACATMSSGNGTTAQAGSCTPAMANRGAIVYAKPDSTSNPVATIPDTAQVCADLDSVGFGYRHVKLNNGKEGYVAENELSI